MILRSSSFFRARRLSLCGNSQEAETRSDFRRSRKKAIGRRISRGGSQEAPAPIGHGPQPATAGDSPSPVGSAGQGKLVKKLRRLARNAVSRRRPITGPVKFPNAETIARAVPGKCELAHNRAASTLAFSLLNVFYDPRSRRSLGTSSRDFSTHRRSK
jgi:hypothetical protein